jgi:hypothetical protein
VIREPAPRSVFAVLIPLWVPAFTKIRGGLKTTQQKIACGTSGDVAARLDVGDKVVQRRVYPGEAVMVF